MDDTKNVSILVEFDITCHENTKCQKLTKIYNNQSEVIHNSDTEQYEMIIDVEVGTKFVLTADDWYRLAYSGKVSFVNGRIIIDGYQFEIVFDNNYWNRETSLYEREESNWTYFKDKTLTFSVYNDDILKQYNYFKFYEQFICEDKTYLQLYSSTHNYINIELNVRKKNELNKQYP